MDMLKTGDRVVMRFEHVDTGEEKVAEGTVSNDEMEFFDWVSVVWDGNPVASLFPVSVHYLERVGADK